MKIQTTGKAIELLNRALPYPEQMKNIDLSNQNCVCFDWRGSRYKLDMETCGVMLSKGQFLEGDNSSLLMERLIKKELASEI